MSAIGQFFIFFLVRSFSALTLVTVTTTRKFFTVLASIFWFKHALTTGQWASVGESVMALVHLSVYFFSGSGRTLKGLSEVSRETGRDAGLVA